MRVVLDVPGRRLPLVVGGQERDEVADVLEARLLEVVDEECDAGAQAVDVGAADTVEDDRLAGHRLNCIGVR